MDGNIVVDGVLASCHASSDHDMAQLGTVPLQWFPEITLMLLGEDAVSPSLVSIEEELKRWMLPFAK